MISNKYVQPFTALSINDVEKVGGKNASLGEMISNLTNMGVKVPDGFATTSQSYREFLEYNNLYEKIYGLLKELNVDDVLALANAGTTIRNWVLTSSFPVEFEQSVSDAYYGMLEQAGSEISVAIRSSATAEDLPEASFAGQQETFLNISGIDSVLEAMKEVFASLFNDRAIAYRVHQGFSHEDVALSVGVQRMVRSDLAASGVMFTLDTESGFNDVVLITSSYGLGEMVVQGAVNPDEFFVSKPALKSNRHAILSRRIGSKREKMVYGEQATAAKSVIRVNVNKEDQIRFSITDEEIKSLAHQAMLIEQHYQRPMDIEWAKDGKDGELYIVQARPETVKSRDVHNVIERYELHETSLVKTEGRSIGQRIGQGVANVLKDINEMHKFKEGEVLVTDMTDPDWEPIMKKASAIVTNRGGRTCHAAIIARELGITAVVGCGDATANINKGDKITVSCAEGDTGFVYDGLLKFTRKEIELGNLPNLQFKINLNVGNPERAFSFRNIPNHGVGLARVEFIINQMIGVHPKALLDYERLPETLKKEVHLRTAAYPSPVDYYVDRLVEGIATLGTAFAPKPVIIRMSDFKSNEYKNLLGGDLYEPDEENPMIGFRGASRYLSNSFRECFALECCALKRVREDYGLENIQIMIPFVRTLSEAKGVIDLLAEHGLKRGENNLKIIMMCEIPSNAILADKFLDYFDGFSIGSNDLTQLTLGLDRDSGLISHLFDERNEAVKELLKLAIQACKKRGKYIGICGQGPSDYPDFAAWLMQQGIESVSLNPDSVIETWLYLAKLNT